MNNLVENLITTLILVALALTAWFMAQDSDKFGTSIPEPVAFFETSLQSSITSSDTSMTLVDFETADGTNLATGTTYGFVIDEGSSNQEIVLGTASTSNQIVSMTRGVSAVTGRTSVSDLKSSHRRGASVKITDAPVLLTLARILNGDDTVPNVLEYESSVSTSTIDANNQYMASKAYVDSVSYSGTPDADLDTKGIVEQATTSELASGASSGDTSAPLFAPLQFFNTSALATTVPVTDNSGKLAQGWLDLTENFTFSGNNTYSGKSTFSGNVSIAGTSTMATATIDNLSVTDGLGTSEIATGTDGQYLMSTSTGATWVDLGTGIGTSTTNFTEGNDYQNTGSRPDYVIVVVNLSANYDGSNGNVTCNLSLGPTTGSYSIVSNTYLKNADDTATVQNDMPLSTIVPGGYYYKVTCSVSGTQSNYSIDRYSVIDF